jgi:hypothetical protein
MLVYAGCGAADRLPPVFGPTPLSETTLTTDQVLVNFRVERVEEFQATEFRFNGSVKNLGNPLVNARFEVVSTRNIPDPNGNRASNVIAIQSYGTLIMGQTQPIAVVGIVPNVDNVSITGRFAHD